MTSKLPPIHKQAWGFIKSAGAVLRSPGMVSSEEYSRRLEICDTCPQRLDNRCLACGCYIGFAAKFKAKDCPIKKWVRWKTVRGYDGKYLVSNYGQIKGLVWMVEQRTNVNGRNYVVLYRKFKRHVHYVDLLVLRAFVGSGTRVLHLDGNNSNDNLENLKWE